MKDISIVSSDAMSNKDAKPSDNDSLDNNCVADLNQSQVTVMDLTERLVEMSCVEISATDYFDSYGTSNVSALLNTTSGISPHPSSSSAHNIPVTSSSISPSYTSESEIDVIHRQSSYVLSENRSIPGPCNLNECTPEFSDINCEPNFNFNPSASSDSYNLTVNVLTDTAQIIESICSSVPSNLITANDMTTNATNSSESFNTIAHSSNPFAANDITTCATVSSELNTSICTCPTFDNAETYAISSEVSSLLFSSPHQNIADVKSKPHSQRYPFIHDPISKGSSGTDRVDCLNLSVPSQDTSSELPFNVTLFSEEDCLSAMDVTNILTDLSNDTGKISQPPKSCQSSTFSESSVNALSLNSFSPNSDTIFNPSNSYALLPTPTSQPISNNLRIHLDQVENQEVANPSHLCDNAPRKHTDPTSLLTDHQYHAQKTETLEFTNIPKLSLLAMDSENEFDNLIQPTSESCSGNQHLSSGHLTSSDENLSGLESAKHPECVETRTSYCTQSASSMKSSNVYKPTEGDNSSINETFSYLDLDQSSRDVYGNQSQSSNSNLVTPSSPFTNASFSTWLKNDIVNETDSLLSSGYVSKTLCLDSTSDTDSSIHQDSFIKSSSETTIDIFNTNTQALSSADVDEYPDRRYGEQSLNMGLTSSIKTHLVEKLKGKFPAGGSGSKSGRHERERKRKGSSISTLDGCESEAKSPNLSDRSDSNSSEDKGDGDLIRRLEKREKNRIAAQKCRRQQLDKMESLTKQIHSLESKQERIKDGISKLEMQKEELETMLKFHIPMCKVKESQTD